MGFQLWAPERGARRVAAGANAPTYEAWGVEVSLAGAPRSLRWLVELRGSTTITERKYWEPSGGVAEGLGKREHDQGASGYGGRVE